MGRRLKIYYFKGKHSGKYLTFTDDKDLHISDFLGSDNQKFKLKFNLSDLSNTTVSSSCSIDLKPKESKNSKVKSNVNIKNIKQKYQDGFPIATDFISFPECTAINMDLSSLESVLKNGGSLFSKVGDKEKHVTMLLNIKFICPMDIIGCYIQTPSDNSI